MINLNLAGIAAYATFDFTFDGGRYIIDNVGFTTAVPTPNSILLFLLGLTILFSLVG